MVKQFGVNLFAVIICTLVLLTGWGCTKKISTTDNVISEPGKGQHETESKASEEVEYIQEASISDERGRITEDKHDSDSLLLKLEDIFFDFDKEVISSDNFLIKVKEDVFKLQKKTVRIMLVFSNPASFIRNGSFLNIFNFLRSFAFCLVLPFPRFTDYIVCR